MKKDCFLQGLCLLLFLTVFAGRAYGQEQKSSWELVVGGGSSLDGDRFAHALIAPALSITRSDQKSLVYRVEGDIELIKAKRHITAVIGVAPFLRLLMSSRMQGPFVEMGAGANVMTSNHTGRKTPGGAFTFSLMGGAGYQFPIHDRSSAVSFRFRHLSNSNLYSPNQGINSVLFLVSIGL